MLQLRYHIEVADSGVVMNLIDINGTVLATIFPRGDKVQIAAVVKIFEIAFQELNKFIEDQNARWSAEQEKDILKLSNDSLESFQNILDFGMTPESDNT